LWAILFPKLIWSPCKEFMQNQNQKRNLTNCEKHFTSGRFIIGWLMIIMAR
jgi:hypothetical protein